MIYQIRFYQITTDPEDITLTTETTVKEIFVSAESSYEAKSIADVYLEEMPYADGYVIYDF